MYEFSEWQIFIIFFIIGLIIGIIFDFFRAIRKSFKTNDFITLIEDIFFIIISGNIIVLSLIKIAGGNVRFYMLFAIFLVIYIYFLTISNFCVIILYVFVELCKKIVEIPVLCIIKLLNNLKKILKKDF